MARRVTLVESTDPLDEGLHPSLLENTHQGGGQSLSCIGRDFCDGSLRPCSLLHIAARNLLKLQISCHVRRHENVCQLAAGHEQFRDQVDVPVVDTTIFLPWLFSLIEITIFLK